MDLTSMQPGMQDGGMHAISRPDFNQSDCERNLNSSALKGDYRTKNSSSSSHTLFLPTHSVSIPSASAVEAASSLLVPAGLDQLNSNRTSPSAFGTHDHASVQFTSSAAGPAAQIGTTSSHGSTLSVEPGRQQQYQQLQQLRGTQPYLLTEQQLQHQLYLQQLPLQQRLHAMPGSTTHPWYSTFGLARTTASADNTFLLDGPQQYKLINHAKLNKQSVGPHWRSVHSNMSFTPPTPSPRFPSFPYSGTTLSGVKDEYHQHHVQQHESHVQQPFLERIMITASIGGKTTSMSPTSSSTASSPASLSSSMISLGDNSSAASSFSMTSMAPSFQYESESDMAEVGAVFITSPSEAEMDTHCTLDASTLTRRGSQRSAQFEAGIGESFKRNMKRKATWQEDNSTDPTMSYSTSLSTLSVSDVSNPASIIQSISIPSIPSTQSIRQSIPTVSTHQIQHYTLPQSDQADQGMTTAATYQRIGYPPVDMALEDSNSISGQMSVDVSAANSVDQDSSDDDVGEEGGVLAVSTKRTKPRLDMAALQDAQLAEMEARRQDSGQRTVDIIQECFYNAAAAVSR
ncbi:hypothetical protein EDD11_004653 [Mortierella claussenii]|nr:hypothetical protein EDD11_004653 [Mortierella claussenii]